MSSKTFLVSCCLVTAMIFGFVIFQGDDRISKSYIETADQITEEVMKKLCHELELEFAGTGGGMMDNIYKMSIFFRCYREVELDEARKLIVKGTEDYLQAINANKAIRPCLHNYPFTSKQVMVAIEVLEPTGYFVPNGKICYIRSGDGFVYYTVKDVNRKPFEPRWREETYEEALRIVTEENKTSQLVMNVEK